MSIQRGRFSFSPELPCGKDPASGKHHLLPTLLEDLVVLHMVVGAKVVDRTDPRYDEAEAASA